MSTLENPPSAESIPSAEKMALTPDNLGMDSSTAVPPTEHAKEDPQVNQELIAGIKQTMNLTPKVETTALHAEATAGLSPEMISLQDTLTGWVQQAKAGTLEIKNPEGFGTRIAKLFSKRTEAEQAMLADYLEKKGIHELFGKKYKPDSKQGRRQPQRQGIFQDILQKNPAQAAKYAEFHGKNNLEFGSPFWDVKTETYIHGSTAGGTDSHGEGNKY